MKIWECTIGVDADVEVPDGADAPMRRVVSDMFLHLTGKKPDFLFSGWGTEKLPDSMMAVIENRKPIFPPPEAVAFAVKGPDGQIGSMGWLDIKEFENVQALCILQRGWRWTFAFSE